MSGRGTQYAGRVGLRPSVGDAIGGLVRPLGAFERMFHLNQQKSTKHFCICTFNGQLRIVCTSHDPLADHLDRVRDVLDAAC
jgi:hypothetical protein